MMNIRTQQQGKTFIAIIEGRVDGATSRQFHDDLEAAITRENQAVLLDLEECGYISSAGLRVILLLARMCQKQGAELAICSMSEAVREVFSISGFKQLIASYPTREEALSNLGA